MRISPSPRFSHGSYFFAIALANAIGCAPAAVTPAKPTSDRTKTLEIAATHSETDEIAVELSGSIEPIARPADVLMTIRIGAPKHDLRSLRPFFTPDNEFGRAVLSDPEQVAMTIFGSLGAYLNLDAPVDIAAFDPKSGRKGVFSFLLTDFQAAFRGAKKDFQFIPEEDGRILVIPRRGARYAGGMASAGLSCAIYRGGAPVASHFVCAPDSDSLDLAGPYLARTVSLEKAKPGLHVQVTQSLVDLAIDKEKTKSSTLPRANIYDAGYQLGRKIGLEWLEDFQDLAIDAEFLPTGVSATVEARFRSFVSPLSVAIVGAGTPSTELRPEFFQVPTDADLAFYFPGAKPETMRPVADAFWREISNIESVDGSLVAGWKEIIAKIQKSPVLKGGPFLIAHGPAASTSQLPKDLGSKDELYFVSRTVAADWLLLASFEPASAWTAALREQLKKPSIFPKRTLEELARTAGSARDPGVNGYNEVALKPTDKLPAGSMHILRATMPNSAFLPTGKTPPLEGPYDTHFYVGGTKEMCWIAVSHNERLAREKLLEALNPRASGLSARQDLAPLRAMPAGGIGFATVKGLSALFGENEDTIGGILANLKFQRAYSAPGGGGTTPIFFSMSSTAEAPSQATLRVKAELDDATLRALIDFVTKRNAGGESQ